MKYIYLLFLFVCLHNDLFSETIDTLIGQKISIGGGILLSNHTASFYTLSPCKTCTEFDKINFSNSSGIGFYISALYSFRINQIFRADIGLGYSTNIVDFKKTKFWTHSTNLEKLYINYLMQPTLENLVIDIGPSITLFDKINIGLYFNLNSVINGKVYYVETLDAQSDNKETFLFSNNKNVFNEQRSQLENLNKILLGFNPSISYDYYILKELAISPKISYLLGFTEIQRGTNWKVNNFAISVNLTYKISDYLLNNIVDLPECPPGFKRDKHQNCIPIDCPPGMILNETGICDCPQGFIKVGEQCEKLSDLADNKTAKNCPPNYFYSEQLQRCEPLIPAISDNCKGAILAIHCYSESLANYVDTILKRQGFTNFTLDVSTDIVDIRKKVWVLKTSCYPSSNDAYNARKIISKILTSLNDDNLKSISIEILIND